MKKLLAMLMAAAMLVSFAACGNKEGGDETTAPADAEPVVAETTLPQVTAFQTEAPAEEETEAEETEAEATSVVEVTNADGEAVTDKDGEAVTETVTKKPAATKKPTTTKAEAKKPESKAEIIEYFNTAVNGVKTDAKSIKQHYVTNYLGGKAVITSGIKSVYNMLGGDDWLDKMLKDNSTGEATYSGNDIKAKFPVENESWASKLTAADVSKATCTEANGIYTITIQTVADAKGTSFKHGEGHNPRVFSIALPGVINDNIPGIAASLVGTASMNYPSGTVVIQVDKGTGKVLTANYDAHWTINFDKMGIVLPLATKSAYTINW